MDHPVGLWVERPARPQRVHVLIRVLLLMALGAIVRSPLWGILYLAIPALVALRIGQRGGQGYLRDDAPRLVRPLRWLARALAYLWLLTDEPPSFGRSGTVRSASGEVPLGWTEPTVGGSEPVRGFQVRFEVEPSGEPTVKSALLRLLTSLPAAFLLALLSAVVGLLWLVAAVLVLIGRWMPAPLFDLIAFVLRFQMRLVAYHLSLVERYPSFGESSTAAQAPLAET
jgi:hypothetical protein